jgi:hypothetical protein
MAKNFNYSIAEELDKGLYPVKEASMAKVSSSTKKISDEVILWLSAVFVAVMDILKNTLARMSRDSRLGP